MLQSLIDLDSLLFRAINGANDPLVDFMMYWATDKWIWIPFYCWILYILIKNFRSKTLIMMLIIAVMITISDQVSVMIKNAVHRLRPCHDPSFTGIIHLVNKECGGMFGFISSHASNTMAFAVFITGILPAANKWLKVEIFAYVLLVCYSRIYLGAHFPGDVIGGWLLGALLGSMGIFAYKKILSLKKS